MALGIIAIYKAPAVNFLFVSQAVAIRVGLERIAVVEQFPIVGQPIAVRVTVKRVGAVADFVKIGQAIVISIGRAVVGVIAAVGFAAQGVAVGVAQRGEVTVPGQGVAVVAPAGQGVKLVQRGREDIEREVIPQRRVQRVPLIAQVADWDPEKGYQETLLDVDLVPFRQVELDLFVDADLREQVGVLKVLFPRGYAAVLARTPIAVNRAGAEAAVNILLSGQYLVGKVRLLDVVIIEIVPGVDGTQG